MLTLPLSTSYLSQKQNWTKDTKYTSKTTLAAQGGGTAILIKKLSDVQNNAKRQNNKFQNPRNDHKNKNKQ